MPVRRRPDRLHHVAEIESCDVVGEIAEHSRSQEERDVESRPPVDDARRPRSRALRSADGCLADRADLLLKREAGVLRDLHPLSVAQRRMSRTWARLLSACAFSSWWLVSISPIRPSERN